MELCLSGGPDPRCFLWQLGLLAPRRRGGGVHHQARPGRVWERLPPHAGALGALGLARVERVEREIKGQGGFGNAFPACWRAGDGMLGRAKCNCMYEPPSCETVTQPALALHTLQVRDLWGVTNISAVLLNVTFNPHGRLRFRSYAPEKWSALSLWVNSFSWVVFTSTWCPLSFQSFLSKAWPRRSGAWVAAARLAAAGVAGQYWPGHPALRLEYMARSLFMPFLEQLVPPGPLPGTLPPTPAACCSLPAPAAPSGCPPPPPSSSRVQAGEEPIAFVEQKPAPSIPCCRQEQPV